MKYEPHHLPFIRKSAQARCGIETNGIFVEIDVQTPRATSVQASIRKEVHLCCEAVWNTPVVGVVKGDVLAFGDTQKKIVDTVRATLIPELQKRYLRKPADQVVIKIAAGVIGKIQIDRGVRLAEHGSDCPAQKLAASPGRHENCNPARAGKRGMLCHSAQTRFGK
jgi:hypothetical protein